MSRKTISEVKGSIGGGVPYQNVLRIAANVADTETVTIGAEVYEIDTAAAPGAITAGNIRVDCNSGVTPTIAGAALAKAINNNTRQGLFAFALNANEVVVVGPAAYPTTETLAGANNAWNATAMYTGATPLVKNRMVLQRAATAQDVALASVRFYVPFIPTAYVVQARTTGGQLKPTNDCTVTVTTVASLGFTGALGAVINVSLGATAAIIATDVVAVIAQE